jgi:tetratricopeptide (TPR) repeat protein
MHERLIEEHPGTVEANKAVLDIRRLKIWDTLNAGDINQAQVLMDEFVADFNQHPYAGNCLGQVALKAYRRGMKLMYEDQWDEAKKGFERAEVVWQEVIDGLDGDADRASAYYYAASNYQQMRRWEEAIEYYGIVVDDYAECKYVSGAQAAVGWCYEVLRDEGKIPKGQANPIIEEAYTAVLADYPDCYVADYVAYRLGEMMFEKGDKAAAARYYRKFLESTYPENERIAEVKAKVARLEGLERAELEGVRPVPAVEGGANK